MKKRIVSAKLEEKARQELQNPLLLRVRGGDGDSGSGGGGTPPSTDHPAR